MATVLDAFVVELGLDPKKFTDAQKKSLDDLKKWGDEAKLRGDEVEKQGAGLAQGIATIRNQALGLFALFAGGMGVKQFAEHITTSTAATGRLARSLGTSNELLSTWRGIATLAGGSAEGMAGSVKHLTDEFNNFAITGQSSVLPYFRALQIDLTDQKTGRMRAFSDIMLDLATAGEKMNPERARAFFKNIGLDEDTSNLLLRGRSSLEKLLEVQRKIGAATEQEAAAAQRLVEMWNKISNKVESLGRKALPGTADFVEGAAKVVNMPATTAGKNAIEWIYDNTWAHLLGGHFSPPGTGGGAAPPAGGTGTMTKVETEAYIREAARKRGINPDVAVAVARSEGLNSYIGDKGTSFGPYQLHYKNNIPGLSNSGLGDKFTAETGLHARDPTTVRQQIDFALDEARKGGWGPWHGWRGSRFAGMGGVTDGPGAAVGADGAGGRTSTVTTEIKIDRIIVNTQATDAEGIARDIKPAIERAGFAAQANTGPQ